MSAWLDDGDVRLYHGDALDVLRGLPDGSVDCVVTSPPYWGLRDYGTGAWAGGNPDCDHLKPAAHGYEPFATSTLGPKRDGVSPENSAHSDATKRQQYPGECGKCGARRVDRQMGLEPTPDLFVTNMVEVFREVRRVLADHGTCWVNLGDSYAAARSYQVRDNKHTEVGNNMASEVPEGLKPKDLVGIPWRVAFALQADGWYLRSDIIWAKPNPMPESVTDRPTKAHEYVFMLTKSPRYWFDTEAVREPHDDKAGGPERFGRLGKNGGYVESERTRLGGVRSTAVAKGSVREYNPAGRNVRSVWQIATQPYPEAHFATFPEELARRCIVAGCPERVCRVCGKPSERIVDVTPTTPGVTGGATPHGEPMSKMNRGGGFGNGSVKTLGWSDCGCMPGGGRSNPQWRPGVTLDPFVGSGTVAKVARDHQRHAVGIDLSETYLELAARRLQQLSLLNEASV